MWSSLLEIILVLLKWIYETRRAPKTVYEKAREWQREKYEEAGAVLEGSGDDLSNLAVLRSRAAILMFRELQLRKAKADGDTSE